MKKINGLVLSTLTAAFLVGCGGGSSDSSTGGAGTPSTETNVTVERGPLYKSTVTDRNGQIAKDNGTNIYTFTTTPVYPITASGGYYETTDGFTELVSPLISDSNVITPITDYISRGTTEEEKEERKTKIKEIMGITNADDLVNKVPSSIGKDAITFTNSLFKILNDGDSTNDDFITDYVNSEFKTKFDELKTLSEGIEDLKEIAKKQEQKVVEDLGYQTLTQADIDNTPKSITLKVADLGRFVSYDGEDWYDDNTFSGDKISFEAWDYGFVDGDHAWVLENEDEYVTITKDATNPYKFSYVDPITKEEGTFTILSTKKLTSYTDLYKTKAQIEVTKKATVLDWYRWDWEEPSYWENNAEVKITDIDGLEKNYLLHNSVINLDNSEQVVIKDDYKVYLEQDDTKQVGTWKKENGQIIVSVGKETKYFKVVSEDGKYFIEEATLEEVGSIDSETIYTGTNLDDFITDIKAPAPVFTSDYTTVADENQTGLFFSMDKTKAFQATVENNEGVTFSLSGTNAKAFKIDSDGIVTFKTAPDFETKRYYDFYVVATNKVGKESWQNIQVKIHDVEETVTPPVDETIFSKSDLVGKKLVVENETFFFEENRVVLGDSGADYTKTLSYTTVASNKIVLSNGDILEKTADGYKLTFDFGTSEQEISSSLSLSTYTSDELNNALNDVEQTSTPTQPTSFVSGKRLDFGNAQSYGKFFTDGKYQESGLNLVNGNYVSYNCSGLWKDLGNNKIGVTCQDNGTTEMPDGIIDSNSNEITFEFSSSNPLNGDNFTITDADGSTTNKIDSISTLAQ
jgi:hypothetical protein